MHPTARRARILELLKDHGALKISELSKELSVTEMTIHRDLKPLVEEGAVYKTFGGVTLSGPSTHSGPMGRADAAVQPAQSDRCLLCGRPPHDRLAFRLLYTEGRIETACCAHCGLLRYKQAAEHQHASLPQAICNDFLTHTTIVAQAAWYVLETSLELRCCSPQVLAFERKDHAERFVKGFGGVIHEFDGAMEALTAKMAGSSCGCRHG